MLLSFIGIPTPLILFERFDGVRPVCLEAFPTGLFGDQAPLRWIVYWDRVPQLDLYRSMLERCCRITVVAFQNGIEMLANGADFGNRWPLV